MSVGISITRNRRQAGRRLRPPGRTCIGPTHFRVDHGSLFSGPDPTRPVVYTKLSTRPDPRMDPTRGQLCFTLEIVAHLVPEIRRTYTIRTREMPLRHFVVFGFSLDGSFSPNCTKSSAIAERPRNAPCQLKACEMSHKCSSNCIW